jgi:hypothetical protein
LFLLAAAPAFAQVDRMYFSGAGGFAITPDGTTGDVFGEVGVRIAPNLFVFGDLGRFRNLQPSQLQPAINDETITLLNSGLTVTGAAHAPAWYAMGGVRMQVPIAVDVGYRLSHVAVDLPLNAQSVTFGLVVGR